MWGFFAPLAPFGYANAYPRIVIDDVEIKQVCTLSHQPAFIDSVIYNSLKKRKVKDYKVGYHDQVTC
jgi:hypothetical protein